MKLAFVMSIGFATIYAHPQPEQYGGQLAEQVDFEQDDGPEREEMRASKSSERMLPKFSFCIYW